MRVLRTVAPAAAAAVGALATFAALAGVTALLLPAGPARAAVAISDPIEFDKWIRVETEHLLIYSNAPADATIDVGRHVEVFRDHIARLNTDLRIDSALPIVLFVFRDDRTFIPYKLLGRGQRAGMAANIDGFFLQHDEGNYLCVNATPANDPWPVIYHEYAHFFLANNFTDIPLWLNEGLAEYFGTFRVDGSDAVMGGPIKSHLGWLREHPPMPLMRLFKIDFESPEYHEDDRQGTYYAQSWAVTHYLLWGPDGPGGGMDRFLSDRKRGDSLAAAVASFTAHPGERDERFLQFLKAKKFPFRTVPLGDRSGAPPPKVTALTRDEAYYRLGDLLRHVDHGRLEAAAEHFRAALRLQPERADAHAGLAQTLFDLGRRDEARAAFEKAYVLAPDDPRIGLRLGLSLVESAFPPNQRDLVEPGALPADLLRGRAILEKLAGREPANALAWAGFGTSYAFDGGDVAPGIAALEKARALLPSRPELAVNLCWLYLRGGGLEKVRPLYEQAVRTSDDKRARAEGLEAVFWADYRMAAAAPPAERDARLAKVLAEAPTPALRAEAEGRRKEATAITGRNQEIERFNAAAKKANAGDIAGAVTLLDALLATVSDPEVRSQATGLRASLQDSLARSEAVRLANAGDQAGAAAILNRLLKTTKDPATQKELRDLLAQVDLARQGALYNDAVAKTKQKDYAAARAILDRLQPQVKDPKLLGLVRDLRRSLDEAVAAPPR